MVEFRISFLFSVHMHILMAWLLDMLISVPFSFHLPLHSRARRLPSQFIFSSALKEVVICDSSLLAVHVPLVTTLLGPIKCSSYLPFTCLSVWKRMFWTRSFSYFFFTCFSCSNALNVAILFRNFSYRLFIAIYHHGREGDWPLSSEPDCVTRRIFTLIILL